MGPTLQCRKWARPRLVFSSYYNNAIVAKKQNHHHHHVNMSTTITNMTATINNMIVTITNTTTTITNMTITNATCLQGGSGGLVVNIASILGLFSRWRIKYCLHHIKCHPYHILLLQCCSAQTNVDLLTILSATSPAAFLTTAAKLLLSPCQGENTINVIFGIFVFLPRWKPIC